MTATSEQIAAAWRTWRSRHGERLGPGPAFKEAIDAAMAAAPEHAALLLPRNRATIAKSGSTVTIEFDEPEFAEAFANVIAGIPDDAVFALINGAEKRTLGGQH